MLRLLVRSIKRQPIFSSHCPSLRSTSTWEPTKQQGDGDGPNHKLVTYLTDEMYMAAIDFPLRSLSSEIYDAIKTIHALEYPLTLKHISQVPNIPQAIVPKIITFLSTGTKSDFLATRIGNTHEAVELATDTVRRTIKVRIINALQKVNGIGPIKAQILYDRGCTSVEQLRNEPYLSMLPKPIQASVLFGNEAEAPLTRLEAEAFQNTLQNALPQSFDVLLLGSYRREASSVTDLDFVLFHPSYVKAPAYVSRTTVVQKQLPPELRVQPPPALLQEAIGALKNEGFVLNSLSDSPSRWQGLIKIQHENNELVRKLAVYLMPQVSRTAAVFAFTGDVEYFHMCKKKAKEQSLVLNEYGLWRQPSNTSPSSAMFPYISDPFDLDTSQPELFNETEWELIDTPEEADMLSQLQLNPNIPHYKRNYANISKIGVNEPLPVSFYSEPITWHIRDHPLWHISQFSPVPLRAKRLPDGKKPRGRQNEKRRVDSWESDSDKSPINTTYTGKANRQNSRQMDSKAKSTSRGDWEKGAQKTKCVTGRGAGKKVAAKKTKLIDIGKEEKGAAKKTKRADRWDSKNHIEVGQTSEAP